MAAVFPTVGRFAVSGQRSLRGARLAVEAINASGGVHGRPIELLEYETGSYFVDARRGADLAVGHGALAFVGSNASSLSEAVAEVAEARGVPQVSNVSTAQDLTWDPVSGRDRPFVFRVCNSDVVMGRLLAAFARDTLAAKRVALLYEVGRTYSAKLAKSFAEGFADAKAGRQTREFFYLPLELDFRPQLRDVAAFGADTVFVPGSFSDATLIAMQAERLALRPTFVGGDAWSSRLLFRRGGPSRPAWYIEHCAPPASFRDAYRARFQEEADCRAALAHDAVQAVMAGLTALGPLDDLALGGRLDTTRVRLRGAISAASVPGHAGTLRFDAHGDVERAVALMEVRPGPGGPVAEFDGWLAQGRGTARGTP